jgi:ferredoxin-NADP reductase
VAELKQGVVSSWRRLSEALAVLRLLPEPGSRFPDFKPGQYIALRREDCRLTRRVTDERGRTRYVTDLDASGQPRRGPVTHSYSVASAPFETSRDGHLEFYLVMEQDEEGMPGRLTESLFHIDPERGEQVRYYNRITGDFTLDKRAAGFKNVLFVGTGTGVAPFVSMLKQLHHEAGQGRVDPVRYTLVYANRTRAELAYHEELSAIAASGRLDFVYVGSVSRPSPGDTDPGIGAERANNLLRHVLGMPLKEEEDLAAPQGVDGPEAQEALRKAVQPRLPRHLSGEQIRRRLDPASTVVLTCGNPAAMAEIKRIADRLGMRFENEEWKPSRSAGS